MGYLNQERKGTRMCLIALAAEGLAIWDGADRNKASHGLVRQGDIRL